MAAGLNGADIRSSRFFALANRFLKLIIKGDRRMNKILLVFAALVTACALRAAGSVPQIGLTGRPVPAVHDYKLVSTSTHIEPDGQRKVREVYTVWLRLALDSEGTSVTCRRFAVRDGGKPEVEIPSLKGWSYRLPKGATDERGQLFGIEQAKFARLLDEKGQVIPPGTAYMVFNTFVDFHSFCQVFAERTETGGGIQDLHRLGDKIVHVASFGEAPVSLGSMVEPGSTFKNGEITLELKGTTMVNGESSAIVGYDSGDSSLHMTMVPAPQMKVEMKGGSHYWGDLVINLQTQWVEKATLSEIVVSETTVPGMPEKIHSVIERWLVLEPSSGDR
jgi:hypothetical protein